MLKTYQHTGLFVIVTLLTAGCASVLKNEKDAPKTVNNKPVKYSLDKRKEIPTSMSPMAFKATGAVVSRYDQGPAYEERWINASKLASVPTSVKKTVLQYEQKKPTQYSLPSDKLSKCSIIGKQVEIDNNPTTYEWIATTADSCFNPSPKKMKTIWIVQVAGNKAGKILLVDRGHRLFISRKAKSSNTKIEVESWTQQPTDYNSGATIGTSQTPLHCYSNWIYTKGRISRKKDWAEFHVKDSMLPKSIENLGVAANEQSQSISKAMRDGTFACPKQ